MKVIEEYILATRRHIDTIQQHLDQNTKTFAKIEDEINRYEEHIFILKNIVAKYTKLDKFFDSVNYYTTGVLRMKTTKQTLLEESAELEIKKQQAIQLLEELTHNKDGYNTI